MNFTNEMRMKSKETQRQLREMKKNKREVNINGKIIELDKVPQYKRNFYLKLENCNTPMQALKLMCYECSNYST